MMRKPTERRRQEDRAWPTFQRRTVAARCALLIALLTLLHSCGMFSARPAEHPSTTSNADTLHFSQLTANTEYAFTKLQYEDLFQGKDPIYLDNNSGPASSGLLIQRLRQIFTADPNIQVSWSGMIPTPTSSPDTIIIPEAKYAVTYHTGDSTVNDSGSSIFTIAHDASWHICYWKDFPGKTGPSFFSPNFSH